MKIVQTIAGMLRRPSAVPAAAMSPSAPEPSTLLGRYNRESSRRLGWTLPLLAQVWGPKAPTTFDDSAGFEHVQRELAVRDDGWFGEASYREMMRTHFAHHIIVGGYPFAPPAGLAWANWHIKTGKVARLPYTDRQGRPVDLAVIHESVTTSQASTERVLVGKGCSVHVMISPGLDWGLAGAMVTQHGDIAWDRMVHASGQNGPSVGIEVVNPYYPEKNSRPQVWAESIEPCRWADDGRDTRQNYVVPTLDQLEALTAVLEWLTTGAMHGNLLAIPREYPGFDVARGHLALSRVNTLDARKPGIWHHAATAHSDGGFPRLYAFLRLERGLPPPEALGVAKRLATTGERFAVV